ncbi:MAG: hypothetical protein H7841_17860, partial [Magnetospirillum sp. WYHS-4]
MGLFWRDDDDERRNESPGSFLDLGDDDDENGFFGRARPRSYFSLADGVGLGQANKPEDVAKVQSVLANWNDKPFQRFQGPTGFLGEDDVETIRGYQGAHGLRIDGYLRPGGETVRSLRRDFKDRFRGFQAPTEREVEDHHTDLKAGGPGLIAWRQPLPKIQGDGRDLPEVPAEDRAALDRSVEVLRNYADPTGFAGFSAREVAREGLTAAARGRY